MGHIEEEFKINIFCGIREIKKRIREKWSRSDWYEETTGRVRSETIISLN